jgi:hypothetical protein
LKLPLLEWKKAVIPGLYFLTVEPTLVVYGKILQIQQEGYIWAYCYDHTCRTGEDSKLHHSEITTPLSVCQFRLAWNLGWPSGEKELSKILNLPPD